MGFGGTAPLARIESRPCGLLHHVLDAGLSDEHGGQTGVLDETESRGHARSAQVAVHETGRETCLGEREGEVHSGVGLTLTRHRTCHRDDPGRLVDLREFQVGTKLTKGFGTLGVVVGADERLPGDGPVVRNRTETRQRGELAQRFAGLERGVEGLAQGDDSGTEQQAAKYSCDQVQQRAGRGRTGGSDGFLGDAQGHG